MEKPKNPNFTESSSRDERLGGIEARRDERWQKLNDYVKKFKEENHYDDITYGAIRGSAWAKSQDIAEGKDVQLTQTEMKFKAIMDKEKEIEDAYAAAKKDIDGLDSEALGEV